MRKATMLLVVVFVAVALFAGVGTAAVINGGNGADRLVGTAQNDTLRGFNGPDVLKGLGGDDRLKGGRGKDTCRGGAGDDTFFSCEAKFGLP